MSSGVAMKKILFLLMFLLVFYDFSQASGERNDDNDSDEYVKVPFNLGLWPGISTGDLWAEEAGHKKIYNTGFALSLVGMRAARLRGMDLAGIFSIYSEGVQGVQASGIFNIVNGNITGLQAAGIFSIVNGDFKGIQGNGIFGVQNGNFKGIQATGIFNIQNGDFAGIQGTSIFNIQNGDFRGAQFNGVFGVQNGDFTGAQFSEVFNIQNGDFTGAQVSGIFNILSGGFRGFQASLINITGYFDRGVQVGLVNVAENHNGVPVGLVTIVKDVPFSYDVWYDNLRFVNIGLRSGNDDYYNLISVGRRLESDINYYTLGAGFGRKVYLNEYWNLDVGLNVAKLLNKNFKDGKYEHFIWKNSQLGYISRINLVFRYGMRYRDRGSIFLGPTINVWYSKLAEEDITRNLWVDKKENNYFLRVWPGFVVGVEL